MAIGIVLQHNLVLKLGAGTLVVAAILYVINTGITLLHQPSKQ